jgi:hypothetical protein
MNRYHVRTGDTHMLIVDADAVTRSEGTLEFWAEEGGLIAAFAPGGWVSVLCVGEVEDEE